MTALSKRTSELGKENAFTVLAEVNERLREGAGIKNFCICQPDFDTPEHIKEAAIKAIKGGKTGYWLHVTCWHFRTSTSSSS